MFKFTIGAVVNHVTRGWGHVTGFALNPSGETIVLVQFAEGTHTAIRPYDLITGI